MRECMGALATFGLMSAIIGLEPANRWDVDKELTLGRIEFEGIQQRLPLVLIVRTQLRPLPTLSNERHVKMSWMRRAGLSPQTSFLFGHYVR